MKKKVESFFNNGGSSYQHTPKKHKGERKEKDSPTPPGSMGGEGHDNWDNNSESSNHQSKGSKSEGNPHVALMESFQNQLIAFVYKNDLQDVGVVRPYT